MAYCSYPALEGDPKARHRASVVTDCNLRPFLNTEHDSVFRFHAFERSGRWPCLLHGTSATRTNITFCNINTLHHVGIMNATRSNHGPVSDKLPRRWFET